MSRAARRPKTEAELSAMSLEEIDAELAYLHQRAKVAGTSVLAKLFRKEIARAERARQRRFHVAPHRAN